MKKISLKNLDLGEVEQLSKEQLKSVLGGVVGSGSTSCSCTLTAKNGESLTLPSSTTSSWDTEEKCSSNCKKYCDGANSGGGSCETHSAVFGSTGP